MVTGETSMGVGVGHNKPSQIRSAVRLRPVRITAQGRRNGIFGSVLKCPGNLLMPGHLAKGQRQPKTGKTKVATQKGESEMGFVLKTAKWSQSEKPRKNSTAMSAMVIIRK
jgi:hypothetical protein